MQKVAFQLENEARAMKTRIPITPENVPLKTFSPLSPFKTQLRLLQFLGWPLKIANDEATEVKKRPWSILVLICYLAYMMSLLAAFGIGFAFSSTSVSELNEYWDQQHLTRWERNSLYVITLPNLLWTPVALYYLYMGLDNKMTPFLKGYAAIAPAHG